MAKSKYNEETFEAFIEQQLCEHGGYVSGTNAEYDRAKALLPQTVVRFLEASQAQKWQKLQAILKDKLQETFLRELVQVLDKRGTLATLRSPLEFYGQKLDLAYFEPGNTLNPTTWDLYGKNILTVVRQIQFDPKSSKELDLVLFLNGLPIVTAELKNHLTCQNAEHAKKQYRNDRDPKAPLFVWTKRALVHFAVDTDEAWMTTKLERGSTFFLPFNKGDEGGKGNPAVTGKHKTHYLWEEVWERRSMLDIVGRFLHLQSTPEVDPNTGKKTETQTLIFPRYHQMDCVRKLERSAKLNGPGTNYLVQHSAGSGKSNSIAWLAYRLSKLHDEKNDKVYHSVVVITDRRVLDSQLQQTIYDFDHTPGLVQKIDEKSDQLAQALQGGVPIIISTIHKFGFIQDKIESLPDRRYAVIVDEAHSSQSGEMAVKVKEMLSSADDPKAAAAAAREAEIEALTAPDQLALRAALYRGPQPNISFFAFTATPKFKTLELFGHKGPNGRPAPFHLYSMRQAIEEKFILDVLQCYVSYSRFFQLNKETAADPNLDKRKAAAALTKFVNLHPTNVAQKVEIIVEHFRSCVASMLGGKAKAMLVTGSRIQAVKYKLAFDRYVKEKGYTDLSCLVAFSGEVKDEDLPGESFTEVGMNDGIKESELPLRFASDAHQMLIVANKYQTGFDQPLLCAMYVDKRLSGIQAVQTLSRLNRMKRGKEQVFVLDFVNKTDEILASFQDYYEGTTTAEEIDPQRLYALKYDVEQFHIFTPSEVDGFAEVFYKLHTDKSLDDHPQLNSWLDPAVQRFSALANEDEGTEKQEDFRGKLQAFQSIYSFLAQIVPFRDIGLEKLYAYGRMLLRKLPRPEGSERWDPGDDVILASLKIQMKSEGDLGLVKGEGGELTGPSSTGTASAKPPKEKLSTIIEMLNEKFGSDFSEHTENFIIGVQDDLKSQPQIQLAAHANDKANFSHVFLPALENALVAHHSENGDFVNELFSKPELRQAFSALMMDRVYGTLQPEAALVGKTVAPITPFRRVPLPEAKPFANCIPALDLKIAAGSFTGAAQDPGQYDWVAPSGRTQPGPGLFVAQVVGESMNRRIADGSWCVWRINPSGSRQGKIVLAQHRDISDPEHGGQYTVKIYSSDKVFDGENWTHTSVTLTPDSTDASFEPIVLRHLEEGAFTIVAELVEVL